MTDLAPTPKQERKARNGGLFVTDAELLRRLGVPEKRGYQALEILDANPKSGFPQKDPLWGDRRYYPAVRAYLDVYYQGKIGISPFRRNAA
jgi:hypothetical protein